MGVEAKYEALRLAHERLREENLRLEKELFELKGQMESTHLAQARLRATGSRTGRTLASIHYEVPKGLGVAELRQLAFEHLREKRFQEAAASFERYLNKPEVAGDHDAPAMYSAGVAWFQIGNFKKSRDTFEAARAHAAGEQKEKIRKKVDLWIRVIDRKLASHEDPGQGG
jgi:hypothetical protein